MPETGLTIVATTNADCKAAPGYGYDNVSGLAFLLFTNECVMGIVNVTVIVFIISITIIVHITSVTYIIHHNHFD